MEGIASRGPEFGGYWTQRYRARETAARITRRVEIGVLLPNNQRQHRTLHVQKDVLPFTLCELLCPVSAALARIFRMDSVSTSYLRRVWLGAGDRYGTKRKLGIRR